MQINVPLRPVRYAIVALHALRESLTDLEDRLEEFAETIDDQPEAKAKTNRAKRKAKTR